MPVVKVKQTVNCIHCWINVENSLQGFRYLKKSITKCLINKGTKMTGDIQKFRSNSVLEL